MNYHEMALEALRRRFPLCTVIVSSESSPGVFMGRRMTLLAETYGIDRRRYVVRAVVAHSELIESVCPPERTIQRVVEQMAAQAADL